MTTIRSYRLALISGACALGVVAGFGSQSADAAGKGPRAGVSVATVCAVDGSDFTVEMRVRDKTSGGADARVAAWDISARVKEDRGRWENQPEFATASMSGLSLPVPVTISHSFSLCVPDGAGHYEINPAIAGGKALNGLTEVTYGKFDGEFVVDQRTVSNRCSDDPQTEDVVEPAGISLTPALLSEIATACAGL